MNKRYLLLAGYHELTGGDVMGRYDTLEDLYATISRTDTFYNIGIWSKDWIRIIDLADGGFKDVQIQDECIDYAPTC